MLAVYAVCEVKDDKITEFENIAKKMVEASQKDQGCLFYRLGKVDQADGVYSFVEHWESREDLKAHMKHEHFTENFPILQSLLKKPVDMKLIEIVI